MVRAASWTQITGTCYRIVRGAYIQSGADCSSVGGGVHLADHAQRLVIQVVSNVVIVGGGHLAGGVDCEGRDCGGDQSRDEEGEDPPKECLQTRAR